MNMIDKTVTLLSLEKAFRKGMNASDTVLQAVVLFLLLACWIQLSNDVVAQETSTAPFLESGGIVVMEAESVPRNTTWQFETTEQGFGGDGYLRYVGPNYFSEPGNNILEFNIVLSSPGDYFLFVFVSHLGAPAADQENDVWTRIDDQQWFKTVHGGDFIDEGFSYHTTWTDFNELGEEIFLEPKYLSLEAGLHTFQIAARSFNVRVDRIHIFDGTKFNYNTATGNDLPESERSNQILTVDTDPVSFAVTTVGGLSSASVNMQNEGDQAITVSDVSITGTDASQFSSNFSGSTQVGAEGTAPITFSFEPTTAGSKAAQAVITHTGLNSPTTVNLFGSASSGGSGSTVLYRVNAGGPAIADDILDWEEDQVLLEEQAVGDAQAGTPNDKVNYTNIGDWSWGINDPITLDPSVPPGIPTEIFQVGRWDPSPFPQMEWDFPVETGTEVEVRLYFNEVRFDTSDDPEGPRVFSATVDGVLVPGVNEVNLFEEHGHDVGVMTSIVVVSDGNVDVDFINSSNDPIIMGIEIVELGSLTRNLDAGWNLVGVPVSPSDANYTSVFDEVTLTGAPYEYSNGSYQQVTTVEAGKGYWINTTAEGSQAFSDDTVESLTLNLVEGWNMISGPGCFTTFDTISDPSGILIEGTLFSYEGGYELAAGLLPGFGYWVQTTGAGSITMDCNSAGKGASGEGDHDTTRQFGILDVQDSGKGSQTLYFGANLNEGVSLAQYMMPPKAPRGRFDVRFNNSGRLSEGDESMILLQSDSFPLTLDYVRAPGGNAGEIVVEEIVNGTVLREHTIWEGDAIEITQHDVSALRITSHEIADVASVPTHFSLKGNYPNPFNPVTQVVFDLPEAASVQVDVFDMLGRKVLSAPIQEMSAGASQRIQINATELASGIYLYTVRAQMEGGRTEINTGRMTLLK